MHVPLAELALLASGSPAPVILPADVLGEVAVAEVQEVARAPDGEIERTPAPSAETIETVAEPSADGEPTDSDVIVVTGGYMPTPGDPLERVNAATFEISQGIDRALVEPVASVYEETLPGTLRSGLRNFLQNMLEPVNFLNGMLQLKPDLALEALGRFAVNSTVGVGGLIDVAKREPFGMEFRRNGFSNTLGYYGVDDGAFLILPLVGVTTVRDVIGSSIDQALVPFAVGAPLNTMYYAVPAYTINSLEFRIKFDDRQAAINASVDPYAAMRESYLCEREADIADLHGRPPPRDCSIDALIAALDGGDEDRDVVDSKAESALQD